MMSTFNEKGLKRLQTIHNGFIFIGISVHRPHNSINEQVFTISDKKNDIQLTRDEALLIADEIYNKFGIKHSRDS